MNGQHAGALNTPASSLGAMERQDPHTARWMGDCHKWLGELLGTPELDVPQGSIPALSEDRAHLGVPAFRLEF